MSRRIPTYVADKFRSTQRLKHEKLFETIRANQTRKFDKLAIEKLEELRQMTQPHWTVNISNMEIPEYVTNVLSLGPNFGLPYKQKAVPMIKVLSGIESALYNNPYADEIRAQMVNIATNFKNNNKKSDRFLLAYVKKTETFMKENSQIIVINADKGNTTIIMNRTEYESSMNKLVNDNKTYTKINRDPTGRIEKSVNELIKNWNLNNKITDKQN